MREMRRILYIALFLCAIWVSGMGYRQVMLAHSEDTPDPTTWLQKQEIERLMRYHGADGMMITPDAAFILRDSKWVMVLKRNETRKREGFPRTGGPPTVRSKAGIWTPGPQELRTPALVVGSPLLPPRSESPEFPPRPS